MSQSTNIIIGVVIAAIIILTGYVLLNGQGDNSPATTDDNACQNAPLGSNVQEYFGRALRHFG